ncbi:MAG: hypothetical protein ACLP3C_17295 [Mycobacterium sp.]|uniref:hypothetical protein n=1 Tax=Mycobacterium sp. TaxID=1785 RepID=UPI003F974EA7
MTIRHTQAAPRGSYTDDHRALWEIEVDHNLRELHVIAAGKHAEPQYAESVDRAISYSVKTPGIRVRDMYCGELADSEINAIPLTAAEARQLACALLAAAEEYEHYLEPATPAEDPDQLTLFDLEP